MSKHGVPGSFFNLGVTDNTPPMNQSNKALRDLVVKMVELLEDCHQELAKADESHWNGTSDSGGHNEAWEAKTKTAQTLIALVTNHIKARLPEKRKLTEPVTNRPVSDGDKVGIIQNNGYNQAIKEFETLLEEVSNG